MAYLLPFATRRRLRDLLGPRPGKSGYIAAAAALRPPSTASARLIGLRGAIFDSLVLFRELSLLPGRVLRGNTTARSLFTFPCPLLECVSPGLAVSLLLSLSSSVPPNLRLVA